MRKYIHITHFYLDNFHSLLVSVATYFLVSKSYCTFESLTLLSTSGDLYNKYLCNNSYSYFKMNACVCFFPLFELISLFQQISDYPMLYIHVLLYYINLRKRVAIQQISDIPFINRTCFFIVLSNPPSLITIHVKSLYIIRRK